MRKTLTTVLFLLSALTFIGSFIIHVATYFGVTVTDRWPFAWVIYLLALALFAYDVADAKARTNSTGKAPLFTAFGPSAKLVAENVSKVLLLYAVVVFAIGFLEPSPAHLGHLERVGGRPVLSEGGRIVRELTETEYAHVQAAWMRGFSAIFLFFSGTTVLERYSLILLRKSDKSS